MARQDFSQYIVSVPANVDIVGATIPMQEFHRAYLVTSWTASAGAGTEITGNQYVEGSVDGTTWELLRDGSHSALTFSSNPAGEGADTASLSIPELTCRYLRAGYTATSGDADCFWSCQIYIS